MLIKFIIEKGCSKSIKFVWKKTGDKETCIRRYYCTDYEPKNPCSSKEENTTRDLHQNSNDSNSRSASGAENEHEKKLEERIAKFKSIKKSLDTKLAEGLKDKKLDRKKRKELVVEYTKNLSDLASLVAFANSYDLEASLQGDESEKEYNEICKKVVDFIDDKDKITNAESLEKFKGETRSFLLSLVSRDLKDAPAKEFGNNEELAKLAQGYGSHFGTKNIGKSLNYTLRACNEYAYESIRSMLDLEGSSLSDEVKEMIAEATSEYVSIIYESQIYHESVSKLDNESMDILIESALSISDKAGLFLMKNIDSLDDNKKIADLCSQILNSRISAEKEGKLNQEELAIKDLKQSIGLALVSGKLPSVHFDIARQNLNNLINKYKLNAPLSYSAAYKALVEAKRKGLQLDGIDEDIKRLENLSGYNFDLSTLEIGRSQLKPLQREAIGHAILESLAKIENAEEKRELLDCLFQRLLTSYNGRRFTARIWEVRTADASDATTAQPANMIHADLYLGEFDEESGSLILDLVSTKYMSALDSEGTKSKMKDYPGDYREKTLDPLNPGNPKAGVMVTSVEAYFSHNEETIKHTQKLCLLSQRLFGRDQSEDQVVENALKIQSYLATEFQDLTKESGLPDDEGFKKFKEANIERIKTEQSEIDRISQELRDLEKRVDSSRMVYRSASFAKKRIEATMNLFDSSGNDLDKGKKKLEKMKSDLQKSLAKLEGSTDTNQIDDLKGRIRDIDEDIKSIEDFHNPETTKKKREEIRSRYKKRLEAKTKESDEAKAIVESGSPSIEKKRSEIERRKTRIEMYERRDELEFLLKKIGRRKIEQVKLSSQRDKKFMSRFARYEAVLSQVGKGKAISSLSALDRLREAKLNSIVLDVHTPNNSCALGIGLGEDWNMDNAIKEALTSKDVSSVQDRINNSKDRIRSAIGRIKKTSDFR